MDPITHAALGAACSQATLGRYNKNIPWIVGALAAMAPDLDVLIRFKNNPMSTELWHRYFTHSFLFIPLGGFLVFLMFLCIPQCRKHWKITLTAALIGYATHGLLDALTSYGTVLLWLFSSLRVSWDIISIVDPIFTIFLIVGIVWTMVLKDQRGVLLGLLCASLMLIFNTFQHHRAIRSVQDYANQKQLNLKQIRAIPTLASSTNWRVIAKNANCLDIFDSFTPVFKKTNVTFINKIPLLINPNIPLTLEQQKELESFLWFTDNYAVIAKLKPLVLADGRYILGSNPLFSLWGIELLPQHRHVDKTKYPLLKERCTM